MNIGYDRGYGLCWGGLCLCVIQSHTMRIGVMYDRGYGLCMIGVMGYVVCLELRLYLCDLYYCHVPLILVRALGSPILLPSCTVITISLHITIILTNNNP